MASNFIHSHLLQTLLHNFFEHLLFDGFNLGLGLEIDKIILVVARLLRHSECVHNGAHSALHLRFLGRPRLHRSHAQLATRPLHWLTWIDIVTASHHTRGRCNAIFVDVLEANVLRLGELVRHVEHIAFIILMVEHIVAIILEVDQLQVCCLVRRPHCTIVAIIIITSVPCFTVYVIYLLPNDPLYLPSVCRCLLIIK